MVTEAAFDEINLEGLSDKVQKEKKLKLMNKKKKHEKTGDVKRKSEEEPPKDQSIKKFKTEEVKSEKTNWKELKMEKKKLKEKRQMAKTKSEPLLFELSKSAKLIWEELRQKSTSQEKKIQLSKTLYAQISTHIPKMMRKHDISRVIECLFECGTPEIRSSIIKSIKGDFKTYAMDKHAHFVIAKILRCGKVSEKKLILEEILGNVRHLLKQKLSSSIVEQAFKGESKTVQQKMIDELYPPIFLLHRTTQTTNIAEFKFPDENLFATVLASFKEIIIRLITKLPKNYWILHWLIIDYLKMSKNEDKIELITLIREFITEFLTSPKGHTILMYCFWYGSAKDRKIMIKGLKEKVGELCNSKEGFYLLAVILEAVDDTTLVSKALLSEVVKNIDVLMDSKYGRQVLSFILVPRDTHFTPPDLNVILATGDSNPFSKKDKVLRREELLESVQEDFLLATLRNSEKWATNNNSALLLAPILLKCHGEKYGETLGKILTSFFESEETLRLGGVFHSLKRLISSDSSDKTDGFSKGKFCESVLSAMSSDLEMKNKWTEHKQGIALLKQMLESHKDNKDIVKRIKKEFPSIS